MMTALLVTFSAMGRLVRELVVLFKKPDARALIVWMIGSTWYWMCGVKDMCGSSVIDQSPPVSTDK